METPTPVEQGQAVESVYFSRIEGRWSLYLVLPENRLDYFTMVTMMNAPHLITGTLHYSDPPGLPTQYSQTPLSMISSYSSVPAAGEERRLMEAAYMTLRPAKPFLTLPFFDSQILSGNHALRTRSCGDDLQWCVAALDALEMEGAVARGETRFFVDWLRTNPTMPPHINLPANFEDFVGALRSYQQGQSLTEAVNREITGKEMKR